MQQPNAGSTRARSDCALVQSAIGCVCVVCVCVCVCVCGVMWLWCDLHCSCVDSAVGLCACGVVRLHSQWPLLVVQQFKAVTLSTCASRGLLLCYFVR